MIHSGNKVKVLSIFGTRPEATKMIPPINALAAHDKVESIICVTAQHRELLDGVLDPLGIVPDYDLNLMQDRQSLTSFTSRALSGLAEVIEKSQPDWILVHGDTATTLAGALAAFYNRVKVGHVEAGLRTYNKYQPFPEEINRKITTVLADLHFAPTELAKQQLLKESVQEDSVVVTGNTAIDFMAYTVKKDYVFHNPSVASAIASLDDKKRIVLMTAHRRETWGKPLENIFRAVKRIVEQFPDVLLIYPVHPNPIVKDVAYKMLSGHNRILLTEPISVFDMHNLMNRAYLVMSDSGGLQEEVPALDKPLIVMREVTERPEGEEAGVLVLAGTNEERVYEHAYTLLTDEEKYRNMAESSNPFGDGKASGRIVEAIINQSEI